MYSKVVFFGFEERASNCEVSYHTHHCDEIVYYFAGDGTLNIDDRSFPFRNGLLSYTKKNSKHREFFHKNGTVLFIGFECPELSSILSDGVYTMPIDSPAPALMHAILNEGKDSLTLRDQMMEAKLNELLITLFRVQNVEKRTRKQFDYAIKYINENYTQNISLQRLAASLGYSYDYFHHEFKAQMHISPTRYIIDLRLRKAEGLLSSSDLSCTEIAYQCGFSTSAQFSTMFRARFGVSPSDLKKGYVGSGEKASVRIVPRRPE